MGKIKPERASHSSLAWTLFTRKHTSGQFSQSDLILNTADSYITWSTLHIWKFIMSNNAAKISTKFQNFDSSYSKINHVQDPVLKFSIFLLNLFPSISSRSNYSGYCWCFLTLGSFTKSSIKVHLNVGWYIKLSPFDSVESHPSSTFQGGFSLACWRLELLRVWSHSCPLIPTLCIPRNQLQHSMTWWHTRTFSWSSYPSAVRTPRPLLHLLADGTELGL